MSGSYVVKERVCPRCGDEHTSHANVCRPCLRNRFHVCACGHGFRGSSLTCPRCVYRARKADRLCADCGKAYHGVLHSGRPQCAACYRASVPGARERAGDRRTRNRIKRPTGVSVALSWRSLWALGLRHCAYCGVRCNPGDSGQGLGDVGPTYPTLDHVTPLVLGGAHNASNAVLACFDCNNRKGNRIATGIWPATHAKLDRKAEGR